MNIRTNLRQQGEAGKQSSVLRMGLERVLKPLYKLQKEENAAILTSQNTSCPWFWSVSTTEYNARLHAGEGWTTP